MGDESQKPRNPNGVASHLWISLIAPCWPELSSLTKGGERESERRIKKDMEFVTKNVKVMASYKAQGDDAVIQGYIHKRDTWFWFGRISTQKGLNQRIKLFYPIFMLMLVVYAVSLIVIIQLRVRVTIIGYKKVNNTNYYLIWLAQKLAISVFFTI